MLGLAAEAVGSVSARREVNIQSSVELDETSCSTPLGGALLLDSEMSTWLVSSKASGV
jgi:hypothetical protein